MLLPRHLQTLQTKVAAAPLEQGAAQRQAQCPEQEGKIATKQLILQGLGCRGEQDSGAAEQHRHQVGKSLSNTRARLDHQHTTGIDSTGNRPCHLGLSVSGLELLDRARQQTSRRENLAHTVFKTHSSGRLVRVQLSLNSSNFIAQAQTFLLESAHQKFIQRYFAAGAVYHGIKISMLNTQVDQPTFGRMQVRVHGFSS